MVVVVVVVVVVVGAGFSGCYLLVFGTPTLIRGGSICVAALEPDLYLGVTCIGVTRTNHHTGHSAGPWIRILVVVGLGWGTIRSSATDQRPTGQNKPQQKTCSKAAHGHNSHTPR